MTALIGQPAPAFTLPAAFPDEPPTDPISTVSLSEYTGRWLALTWYPRDFTFVCPTEITALSDRMDEFADMDCDILAASTDSVYCHRAWLRLPRSEQGIEGVQFPLLADTSHSVAREYGVLNEHDGAAVRALFLIDPLGIIQYAALHNGNVGRSVDETLRVLSALQSGGLCGSDWKPGQRTL